MISQAQEGVSKEKSDVLLSGTADIKTVHTGNTQRENDKPELTPSPASENPPAHDSPSGSEGAKPDGTENKYWLSVSEPSEDAARAADEAEAERVRKG